VDARNKIKRIQAMERSINEWLQHRPFESKQQKYQTSNKSIPTNLDKALHQSKFGIHNVA
jgi:hypothetical protein